MKSTPTSLAPAALTVYSECDLFYQRLALLFGLRVVGGGNVLFEMPAYGIGDVANYAALLSAFTERPLRLSTKDEFPFVSPGMVVKYMNESTPDEEQYGLDEGFKKYLGRMQGHPVVIAMEEGGFLVPRLEQESTLVREAWRSKAAMVVYDVDTDIIGGPPNDTVFGTDGESGWSEATVGDIWRAVGKKNAPWQPSWNYDADKDDQGTKIRFVS
jgi:hypothetical protein